MRGNDPLRLIRSLIKAKRIRLHRTSGVIFREWCGVWEQMPVNLDAIGREPNHISRSGSNRFQQRRVSIFAPKPNARAIAALGRKLGGFALGTEVQIRSFLRLNVNADRSRMGQVRSEERR